MRSLSTRYERACAAIDAANRADPTVISVRGEHYPLAEIHGVLAAGWVERLRPGADETVQLGARAHHLRRWEVPRSSYAEGRPGYLRWRRDQKARHGRDVAALLEMQGYAPEEIDRVQALIRREGLGTDPDAQLVEDAACLVFLETQLADFAMRFERDRLVEIIVKTARKMSVEALGAVAEIPLDEAHRELLADALGG